MALSKTGSGRGSGRHGPQLLRIESAVGGQDPLCLPGAGASRISEGSFERELRPLASCKRYELPDPSHVLGTVADPADAFRMSTQMRSSVLLDEHDVEEVVAGATQFTSSGEESLEASHSVGGNGAVTPAVEAVKACGRMAWEEADAETAAARRGAEVAAAMQFGGYDASGRVPVSRDEGSSRHVFTLGDPSERRSELEAVAAVGLAPGAPAVSHDSVSDSAQRIITVPPPVDEPPAAPALAQAAATEAEAPPPDGAQAPQGAERIADLLQGMWRPQPRLVEAASVADAAAAAGVDSREELRRLQGVVSRLASHLDHMLAADARERGEPQ